MGHDLTCAERSYRIFVLKISWLAQKILRLERTFLRLACRYSWLAFRFLRLALTYNFPLVVEAFGLATQWVFTAYLQPVYAIDSMFKLIALIASGQIRPYLRSEIISNLWAMLVVLILAMTFETAVNGPKTGQNTEFVGAIYDRACYLWWSCKVRIADYARSYVYQCTGVDMLYVMYCVSKSHRYIALTKKMSQLRDYFRTPPSKVFCYWSSDVNLMNIQVLIDFLNDDFERIVRERPDEYSLCLYTFFFKYNDTWVQILLKLVSRVIYPFKATQLLIYMIYTERLTVERDLQLKLENYELTRWWDAGIPYNYYLEPRLAPYVCKFDAKRFYVLSGVGVAKRTQLVMRWAYSLGRWTTVLRFVFWMLTLPVKAVRSPYFTFKNFILLVSSLSIIYSLISGIFEGLKVDVLLIKGLRRAGSIMTEAFLLGGRSVRGVLRLTGPVHQGEAVMDHLEQLFLPSEPVLSCAALNAVNTITRPTLRLISNMSSSNRVVTKAIQVVVQVKIYVSYVVFNTPWSGIQSSGELLAHEPHLNTSWVVHGLDHLYVGFPNHNLNLIGHSKHFFFLGTTAVEIIESKPYQLVYSHIIHMLDWAMININIDTRSSCQQLDWVYQFVGNGLLMETTRRLKIYKIVQKIDYVTPFITPNFQSTGPNANMFSESMYLVVYGSLFSFYVGVTNIVRSMSGFNIEILNVYPLMDQYRAIYRNHRYVRAAPAVGAPALTPAQKAHYDQVRQMTTGYFLSLVLVYVLHGYVGPLYSVIKPYLALIIGSIRVDYESMSPLKALIMLVGAIPMTGLVGGGLLLTTKFLFILAVYELHTSAMDFQNYNNPGVINLIITVYVAYLGTWIYGLYNPYWYYQLYHSPAFQRRLKWVAVLYLLHLGVWTNDLYPVILSWLPDGYPALYRIVQDLRSLCSVVWYLVSTLYSTIR